MSSINQSASPVNSGDVVYVACPVHMFDTERYQRLVDVVRRGWPRAVVLEPKHLYTGNADWLERWPATLAILTTLAFFTDYHGRYGAGVHKELVGARERAVPIWYIADDGKFWPDERLTHREDGNFFPHSVWIVSTPPPRPKSDRPDPRRGPDASLIVASFRSSDLTRHEGVRFRQANAATMRAYQTAVEKALCGDDSGLVAFRRDNQLFVYQDGSYHLLTDDVRVCDTRARSYHLLTDGDAIRAAGEGVSITPTMALGRKGVR